MGKMCVDEFSGFSEPSSRAGSENNTIYFDVNRYHRFYTLHIGFRYRLFCVVSTHLEVFFLLPESGKP